MELKEKTLRSRSIVFLMWKYWNTFTIIYYAVGIRYGKYSIESELCTYNRFRIALIWNFKKSLSSMVYAVCVLQLCRLWSKSFMCCNCGVDGLCVPLFAWTYCSIFSIGVIKDSNYFYWKTQIRVRLSLVFLNVIWEMNFVIM